MTAADYKALAAYLHQLAHAHQRDALLATVHGTESTAIREAAESEQLTHWANGIEAEAEARRLKAVDITHP